MATFVEIYDGDAPVDLGARPFLGGALGGILAGAAGSVAGAATGWVIDKAKGAIDALFGSESDTDTRSAGLDAPPGLPAAPGSTIGQLPGQVGGGGLPAAPGGVGLPTYPGDIGVQGAGDMVLVGGATPGLPAALAQIGTTVLQYLASSPVLAQWVQRRFDFHKGKVVTDPKQDMAWAKLSEQLPKAMQDALGQFLVGFDAPIGLSKAGQDAFLMLMIAESGVAPASLKCCQLA